ncbi:hypothetical protein N2152v2_001415 [Parachlorella kessleri]
MLGLYRLNRCQPGDSELDLQGHRASGSASGTSKGCVVSLWRWVRDLPLNKAVHSLGDGAELGGRQQQRKEASSEHGSTGVRAGFSSLPDHLLERILGQLATRGCSRQTHFNVCAVSRSWRAVGRQLFFASPWAEHRLLCHPAQLFCLSPRPVETSRTGLLKCFVRREARSGMRGYRRYYFYMGRDHRQLRKLRFLMCAVQVSRCEVLIYLNKEAQGSPLGRLQANGFCTRYSLSLAPGWQLAGAPALSGGEPAPVVGRRPAHGCGGASQSAAAAADPRRTLQRQPRRRWRQEGAELQPSPVPWQPASESGWEVSSHGEGLSDGVAAASAGPGAEAQQAAPAVLGSLQYRARLRGFMQPRRVEVELPPLSQLSFGRGLPSLRRQSSSLLGRPGSSRGVSADAEAPAAAQLSGRCSFGDSCSRTSWGSSLSPVASLLCSEPSLEQLAAALDRGAAAAGSSAGEAAAGAAAAAAAEIVPAGAAAVAPVDALPDAPAAWLPQQQQAQQARQEVVVPGAGPADMAGIAGEGLSLHNKQPQWNNDLRCWCLNFRGRVKQASVKNFQLVRGGDPAEKVVLQFGKVERDIYILDFNPTVVTSFQAFCVALSTFDSKIML